MCEFYCSETARGPREDVSTLDPCTRTRVSDKQARTSPLQTKHRRTNINSLTFQFASPDTPEGRKANVILFMRERSGGRGGATTGRSRRERREEVGRWVRLLEASRDRDRKEEKEEEEAGGAKLKLIKDLQYKRREERRGKKKNCGHTVSEGRCY